METDWIAASQKQFAKPYQLKDELKIVAFHLKF